ncbi:hypothetical protein [Rhizobium sp. GR12]|uniref:hypothetical protein n=1 Tax=Rhizobium sp. GR12 TaxID=3053925 RepID=UPI002FBDA3AF
MKKIQGINGPSQPLEESLKYQAECQFALEPSATRLIEMATEAGWDHQQVVYALLNIASTHILDRTVLKAKFTYQ